MADPLREPGFLTEHQLRAVNPARDVFLTACPGSGKTRAAGVRVARLAEDGRRVAACSYTNVGVEQIRRVLVRDLARTPGPEHFVGTLHSFLLRYVLYPFGHLVMGCDGPPRLLADDAGWQDVIFGRDNRVRMPVSRFRYLPDGELCVRSTPPRFRHDAETAAAMEQSQARALKERYARGGVVSFDDAMYWALQVLRDCPAVGQAVARRFDEILVDEAQDTSELQLACLRELVDTGALDSLVLVGDLEQSICSYTGASREGCEGLAEYRGLELVPLAENHRSSQRICDIAVNFCARTEPDRAVGESAECEWDPELMLYPADEPANALTAFGARLAELDVPERGAAVLARSNNLVDELNGHTATVDIAPRPRTLLRATMALRGAGTLGRRQIEAIDRILAFAAWDRQDLAGLERDQKWMLRQGTMRLMTDAPSLNMDLRTWIREAAKALGAVLGDLVDEPRHGAGNVLRSAAEQEGIEASEAFPAAAPGLRAQTVHDIKGESRDAVLVVVDRLRSRRRGAQGALWSRPLLGEVVSDDEAEELRIAFVALTRARRLCVLALPADTDQEILDAFGHTGFRAAA